jgi:hypothetical protein
LQCKAANTGCTDSAHESHPMAHITLLHLHLTQLTCCMCSTRFLFCFFGGVARGDGLPPAGHTQHSQAHPTAGGPRQSLTSKIRITALSQEVPSALLFCYSQTPCYGNKWYLQCRVRPTTGPMLDHMTLFDHDQSRATRQHWSLALQMYPTAVVTHATPHMPQ